MIYVYRNLHIKSRYVWKLSDKPVSRASNEQREIVTLCNVSFLVKDGARDFMTRSIAKGKLHRQVGMFACGEITDIDPVSASELAVRGMPIRITYDPAKGYFLRCDTEQQISHCDYVAFTNYGAYAIGIS